MPVLPFTENFRDEKAPYIYVYIQVCKYEMTMDVSTYSAHVLLRNLLHTRYGDTWKRATPTTYKYIYVLTTIITFLLCCCSQLVLASNIFQVLCIYMYIYLIIYFLFFLLFLTFSIRPKSYIIYIKKDVSSIVRFVCMY